MDNSSLRFLKVALTRCIGIERKCKREGPREIWRRTVEKERMAMGYCSWAETELAATGGVSWSSKISGSTLRSEKRN